MFDEGGIFVPVFGSYSGFEGKLFRPVRSCFQIKKGCLVSTYSTCNKYRTFTNGTFYVKCRKKMEQKCDGFDNHRN
jgi:hypothetical protein